MILERPKEPGRKYALTFTILVVFGIAGLWTTLQPAPPNRRRPEPQVRYEPFQAPANVSDKELAPLIYERIKPSLSLKPGWFAHRDGSNDLFVDFYSVNGLTRVTVLERENRLKIEPGPNNLWQFLNNMHAVTLGEKPPDWRVRLWAWQNEFALWALSGMALSGVYLWLASRPRHAWALYSLGAGSAAFIVLYVITR